MKHFTSRETSREVKLPRAFLWLEKYSIMNHTRDVMQSLANSPKDSWLTWFFRGLMLFLFVVIFGRLAELQIIKGAYYQNLADNNRIRKITIPAPRGKILARGGEVLADSNPNRIYPDPFAFAHLTGYIGEVDQEEVKKIDPVCADKGPRSLGSFIGRSGLESYYDCDLKGIDGEELVEVDTFGNKIRTLGVKQPAVGKDLKTTIDYDLQKKIIDIIKQSKDLPPNPKLAIVVSDAHGQIISLVSSPSFDPENVGNFVNDQNLPLFNRAVSGTYPPGSPFKLATSLAALEEGKIGSDYTFDDQGSITVNDFNYTNWYFTQYGGREGEINLERAIARSTDTFFYKLGELVGPDAIAAWAEKLGFGKKTGIDLPSEAEGLVPSPFWKERAKGERWFLGNTYHMAIGQGDVLATPLQVNQMTEIIASRGEICPPHLKEKDVSCQQITLDKDLLVKIINGMIGACSPGGTAVPFFDFKFTNNPEAKVACKTGTAETFDKSEPHAWFTIFGPVDNPELVVTIMVEHAGEGSKIAAPLARSIFDFYFNP